MDRVRTWMAHFAPFLQRLHLRRGRKWRVMVSVLGYCDQADRATRLIAVPEDGDHHAPLPAAAQVQPLEERREVRHPRPHAVHGPRFLSLDRRLSLIVGLVSAVGVGLGVVGLALTWTSKDLLGLLTVVGLVGVGQALALEADEGSAVLSV